MSYYGKRRQLYGKHPFPKARLCTKRENDKLVIQGDGFPCMCMWSCSSFPPQMAFGSSPAKKYTCAIQPKTRGTNRPPALSHSSLVRIFIQAAMLAGSV